MGMDVYGIKPKENMPRKTLKTMDKFDSMSFEDKWNVLDKDEKLSTLYWEEKDMYEEANRGVYFSNNVWWWRPLWDYCFTICDVIDRGTYEGGQHNSGAGLNSRDSRRLARILFEEISSGRALLYKAHYDAKCEQKKIDSPKDRFATGYPFSVENVEDFAKFLMECGGFKIN